MAILYRPAEPTDLPYFLSTWLQGARTWDCNSFMSNNDYFKYYRNEVIQILGSCFIKVAYEESVPEIITSWLAYSLTPSQELIIHFVYTRSKLWKRGMARDLIASVYPDLSKPIFATMLPKKLYIAIREQHPNIHFNPYLKPGINENQRSSL